MPFKTRHLEVHWQQGSSYILKLVDWLLQSNLHSDHNHRGFLLCDVAFPEVIFDIRTWHSMHTIKVCRHFEHINSERPVISKYVSVMLRKKSKLFLLVSCDPSWARCGFSTLLVSFIPLSVCHVSLNLCLPEAFLWICSRFVCDPLCLSEYICLWQRALHVALLHSIESVTWKGNGGCFVEIEVNVFDG